MVQLVILGHTRKGRLYDNALSAGDELAHLSDYTVGDRLAVANTGIHPLSHHVTVGNYASGDDGAEEIALPTFVETGVWLEPFRIVHFLVTEQKFSRYFGLQNILYEVLRLFPLDDDLSALVADHVYLLAGIGETSVCHHTRFPVPRFQRKAKFIQLLAIELDGVHRFLRLLFVAVFG